MHVHSHSEILTLNVAGADVLAFEIAGDLFDSRSETESGALARPTILWSPYNLICMAQSMPVPQLRRWLNLRMAISLRRRHVPEIASQPTSELRRCQRKRRRV